MEFADGGSLDDAIQRGQGGVPGVPETETGLMVLQAPPLTLAVAVAVALSLALALTLT